MDKSTIGHIQMPGGEDVEVKEMAPRERIMQDIRLAATALNSAVQTAQQANQMAGSVPVFQKMQQMAKELQGMMLEVNKVRGL